MPTAGEAIDLDPDLVGEFFEVVPDALDQATDLGDLLLGRHGFRLGSGVRGERGEPFASAQEVGKVCLEVGKVTDVGAEVGASDAAVPDGAVLPASRDVGPASVRTLVEPTATAGEVPGRQHPHSWQSRRSRSAPTRSGWRSSPTVTSTSPTASSACVSWPTLIAGRRMRVGSGVGNGGTRWYSCRPLLWGGGPGPGRPHSGSHTGPAIPVRGTSRHSHGNRPHVTTTRRDGQPVWFGTGLLTTLQGGETSPRPVSGRRRFSRVAPSPTPPCAVHGHPVRTGLPSVHVTGRQEPRCVGANIRGRGAWRPTGRAASAAASPC